MGNTTINILMADDDPDDLELMQEALLQEFAEVNIFAFINGLSALQHLQASLDTELPTLIVLDYNMGDMTGAEMLAKLSSQHRYTSIPKIILSTSDAPFYIRECLRNGATEYLIKPASVKGLQNLAKKLLAFCPPAY